MAQAVERARPVSPKIDWLGLRHKVRLLLSHGLVYLFLLDISFIFLFPVIYMSSVSLQTIADLIDPTVYWWPSTFNWENYTLAYQALYYRQSLTNSATIALLAALGQVVSGALVGYGFARCRFPGREVLFMLAIFTFLVPPETIIIPLFMLYKHLGFIDTFKPFIWPAFFAHGLRGALFLFIFRQFFRGQPWELEDAARIDGAGAFRTFWQIMLPLAQPAILVTFLFSMVWHWNDFFEPMIYLMKHENFTLPLRLAIFWRSLQEVTGGQAEAFFNEPLIMAASFLVIVVPLLVYLFTQRYFVQSIERTGLVE